MPGGVDDASFGAGSAAPGTGSCFSHQPTPTTATTAAATPSHVFTYAAPTMTSAPTMTATRNRKASASLRSGLRIGPCLPADQRM